MADTYNLLATITSTQASPVTESGTYKIILQGASGNGGSGVYEYGEWNDEETERPCNGWPGGGGGGGGCAISIVKLNAGDTIVYTHANVGSTCKVVVNSSVESYSAMQVTSGQTGSDGGDGGSGGVATGGQENYNGGKGSSAIGFDDYWGTSMHRYGGAGGTAGYTGGNVGGAGGDVGVHTGVPYSESGRSGNASFVQIYKAANEAPPAPELIDPLTEAREGTTWLPAWNPSIDPDGDAVTYVVERSLDGGAWEQVAETSDLSCAIPIPSAIFPGDLVPISWGAAEGAEAYHVQRQINGGDWADLTTTDKTTYSDTAPSSEKRFTVVKYRVASMVGGEVATDYTESAELRVYVAGGEE